MRLENASFAYLFDNNLIVALRIIPISDEGLLNKQIILNDRSRPVKQLTIRYVVVPGD
jgi:hypothetical protein